MILSPENPLEQLAPKLVELLPGLGRTLSLQVGSCGFTAPGAETSGTAALALFSQGLTQISLYGQVGTNREKMVGSLIFSLSFIA